MHQTWSALPQDTADQTSAPSGLNVPAVAVEWVWSAGGCCRRCRARMGPSTRNYRTQYSVRHATRNMRRATHSCVVQRATYNGQHATSNLQPDCRQRPVDSRQGATSMQRTPHPQCTTRCNIATHRLHFFLTRNTHRSMLVCCLPHSRVVYFSCHMSVALRCVGSVDDHNSSLPSVAHPQGTSSLASTHTPPTHPHRPRCAHACYLIALAALCQPSNDVPHNLPRLLRRAALPSDTSADSASAHTLARIAQRCASIGAVRAAGARGGLLLVELQGAEWLCTSDAPAGLQLRLVPPPKGRNAASFPMWSALSALAGYSVVLYRRGEYSQHACARPMSGAGLHWPR